MKEDIPGGDSSYIPHHLLYLLYQFGAMYDDVRPYDHNHGSKPGVLCNQYPDVHDVSIRILQLRLWLGCGLEPYSLSADSSLYNTILRCRKKEGAL